MCLGVPSFLSCLITLMLGGSSFSSFQTLLLYHPLFEDLPDLPSLPGGRMIWKCPFSSSFILDFPLFRLGRQGMKLPLNRFFSFLLLLLPLFLWLFSLLSIFLTLFVNLIQQTFKRSCKRHVRWELMMSEEFLPWQGLHLLGQMHVWWWQWPGASGQGQAMCCVDGVYQSPPLWVWMKGNCLYLKKIS